MIKNRIHALLDKYEIQSAYTDLFGKKGREWLRNLNLRLRVDEAYSASKKAAVQQPILSLAVAFVIGLALGVALARSR